MVKVLVLGATGYIGYPLAQSLRRDGHLVWGLARTPEKARSLEACEITPVTGTMEGGEYLNIIKSANIDIVIDAGAAYESTYQMLDALQSISKQRISQRGRHAPKLGFIYVGGMWVHGSSTAPINDLNPVGISNDAGCLAHPPSLIEWRPKLEQTILDSGDHLSSLIIRPALLYGGQGSNPKLWSLWFDKIHQATPSTLEVHLQADASSQPGLIHVDDVVSGIHLAVNKFELVSSGAGVYPIFDLISSSESLKVILESAARILGYEGKLIFDGPGDDAFAVAMNTSCNGSATRARDLLGWVPKHTSMLEGIEIYVRAWRANL